MKSNLIITITTMIALASLSCTKIEQRERAKKKNPLGIVGGIQDDETLPATVRLEIDGLSVCSGAFISDQHLLTAAHCLAGNPNVIRIESAFEPIASANPESSTYIHHPDFKLVKNDQGRDQILFDLVYSDIGIVKFEPGTAPESMITKLSDIPPAAGDAVTLVGYGFDSWDEDTRVLRNRHVAHNTIELVQAERRDMIVLAGVAATPEVVDENTKGAATPGDSGGALYNADGAVIGITSTSDLAPDGSATVSTYVNITHPDSRSFIDQALQSTSTMCSYAIDGETKNGYTEEECASLKESFETAQDSNSPEQAPTQDENTDPPSTNDVACAFNIDGEIYEGASQEECEKLRQDLGLDNPIPTNQGDVHQNQKGDDEEQKGQQSVSCSYSKDGITYDGTTQEECDQIREYVFKDEF